MAISSREFSSVLFVYAFSNYVCGYTLDHLHHHQQRILFCLNYFMKQGFALFFLAIMRILRIYTIFKLYTFCAVVYFSLDKGGGVNYRGNLIETIVH